jgi:hypothetical protein
MEYTFRKTQDKDRNRNTNESFIKYGMCNQDIEEALSCLLLLIDQRISTWGLRVLSKGYAKVKF